ncbi:MAG TPA: DNA/RNA nuclease SfsA [Rhizobiales bacterium]|nr:DNA/RNA nuclease SfsA [Hyphomicrobiales bacterium]
MNLPSPLISGRLVRRYKRFLADVELDDGRKVTAHCANPGAMTGLKDPGLKVWMSTHDNPKRKLKYSWELAELEGHNGSRPALVGINTSLPNAIVREALEAEQIPELRGYDHLRAEVPYGQNSRIDFLLESPGRPPCYVEVKNVHLMRRPGLAEFPDSVTRRGAKHLDELRTEVLKGNRAVMLYVIQRTDTDSFALAHDIDPTYARNFAAALEAGVEAFAYNCQISLSDVSLDRRCLITDMNSPAS